jgi:hypothetical protein
MQQPNAGELEARRRARRAIMTVYYVVVVVFIVVAAGNVIWQVWSPRFKHYPPEDCRAGLRSLAQATLRAQHAAAELGSQNEDLALTTFRGALLPEWARFDAVAASCRSQSSQPGLSVALDSIDRLRYAEERAVRRETSELAPLRRKVEHILESELAP